MPRQLQAPLLASLLLALGCRHFSERTVKDTEDRTFAAYCERGGACTFEQTAGIRRNDGKSAQALLLGGRLVGICDIEPGHSPGSPEDCRPMVCQKDSDCLPEHGLKDGECLNGLCTDQIQPLVPTDSIMLCLAGSGLGRSQPSQVERFALGLNCGTPCRVPAPCRQP